MDNLDDTPQSPIPDNDWTYNTGAETPEHHSGNEAGDLGAEIPEHHSDNEEVNKEQVSGHNSDNQSGNHSDNSEINKEAVENKSGEEEDNQADTRKSGSPVGSNNKEMNKEQTSGHNSDNQSGNHSDNSEINKEAVENQSDNEDNDDKDQEVDKLMGDIFGDDSGDEKSGGEQGQQQIDTDDDAPVRVVRKGDYSDEEDERPKHRWDFDEIMAQKKAERKKTTKRRRKDGGIDLLNDNDDQIKTIVDQMTRAAAVDRTSNENRQPAFQKHKLLPIVRQTLLKQDMFEALLDNGMMSAVSEWLAPLPDKSLPSLEVRTTLLKILSDFPNLEQGILRQSGLGKAVMYLLKHPREVKENKQRAARLIREWSRPIFQLESDYSSMTRDERIELDSALQNRKRRHNEDNSQGSSRSIQRQPSSEEVINPGHVGFVSRARVPKPSSRAYVHRPKPIIEGQFHGSSKTSSSSRFDIAQRGFKERTKTQKAKRHIGVSIAGNKMEF